MTNGAVALFGKSLERFPQMALRMARFQGTNKNEFIDSQRVEGNYFDLLDAGMAFLFRHLSLHGKIVGFRKEEHLEIPAEALREALTNALCHRQYERYNLTPSIAVFDDRVEIENPGILPRGITPENIKQSHASHPYNPLVATVLFKTAFLENWGSGIGRIIDACHAQGVPEPKYEQSGGFVKIIFMKQLSRINENEPQNYVNEPQSDGNEPQSYVNEPQSYVNEPQNYGNEPQNYRNEPQKTIKRMDSIIALIEKDSTITREELANKLRIGIATLKRDLSILRKKGIIYYEGSSKTGHWKINKKYMQTT